MQVIKFATGHEATVTDNVSTSNVTYRVLTMPYTHGVFKTGNELDQEIPLFKRRCIRKNAPAFISLFRFTKVNLITNQVDRDSAIVDRIKFDIDGNEYHVDGSKNALDELHKFMDYLEDKKLEYCINFSGSDGFGIKLKFKRANVKHSYNVIKRLYALFQDECDVAIDAAATMGTSQKFRIVNSRHQKSKLYAIPLSKSEARTLSMDEIKALAVRPRDIDETFNWSNNDVMVKICKDLDKIKTEGKNTGRPDYADFLDGQPMRPCIQRIHDLAVGGWTPMSMVAFEMVAVGIPDEQIHAWSKRTNTNKYNHSVTQKHIDIIRRKIHNDDLSLHSCDTIKAAGFCVNKDVLNYYQCQQEELEKVRKNAQKRLSKYINSD